jgi:hypothetical protein
MRVLVVWEPILASDWRPPGGAALGRISDGRARQFWDPNHVVASALDEIAKKKPPEPPPACCFNKGFYWDTAILYAPHAQWKDEPSSVFWNGPVYRIIQGLESAFEKQKP